MEDDFSPFQFLSCCVCNPSLGFLKSEKSVTIVSPGERKKDGEESVSWGWEKVEANGAWADN